jgi:hypothetical protein
MPQLRLVCLIFGFVCFVLHAVGVGYQPPGRPWNLQSAGLAFWIATLFLV